MKPSCSGGPTGVYYYWGNAIGRILFMVRKFVMLALFLSLSAAMGGRVSAAQAVLIYRYRPAPVVFYRPDPPIVSYDAEDRFAGAYALQGVVTASVPYHIDVRVHDQLYSISLHDGTVIRPTGITLEPSMLVNIAGYWSGDTFVANRIVVLR